MVYFRNNSTESVSKLNRRADSPARRSVTDISTLLRCQWRIAQSRLAGMNSDGRLDIIKARPLGGGRCCAGALAGERSARGLRATRLPPRAPSRHTLRRRTIYGRIYLTKVDAAQAP
ncbi:hypothetical protein ACJJTC_017960 [Scirpophaga incertulas]